MPVKLLTRSVAALFSLWLLLYVGTSSARSNNHHEFVIGASCAALAYTAETQLEYLTSPDFSGEFYAFCFPEEPFTCSDYSSFLMGFGQLETGSDGFYCRLVQE